MRPIGLADLQQIAPWAWEIPRSFRNDMRVAARLYATREMVEHLVQERALEQLVNTATLPGVQEPALAMPDIHQGYGFPIGGVVATRAADGVISPCGVGYDINCGVRLLASGARYPEVREHLAALATQIQRDVPTGIGHKGRITLDDRAMDDVLNTGLRWAIGAGYASDADAESIEERGSFAGASADAVPERARQRGRDQLGTLGSGNHFLEEHGGVACVVHRKGATRAFGPGSAGIPERYRTTGQPVFVPGSMGTASYVLAGTGVAMSETFGSTCHGAGRLMSRHKAKQTIDYNRLRQELHDLGIEVRAASAKGLIEEAPAAYKDVEQVVGVMAATGVTVTVARFAPIAG